MDLELRNKQPDMPLVSVANSLAESLDPLRFPPPVDYVYNPLVYAAAPHHAYLRRYGRKPCEVLLLGMNPGPWGMAQTGVPFGDVAMVRDWMGIEEAVGKPAREHPKRPVLGFRCERGEVSGTRLWGWARDRFGTADAFFARFFVYNYCPLSFMEAGGRNFTPDKLPAAHRQELFGHCDAALRAVVAYLMPRFAIGVGGFAEKRLRAALPEFTGAIGAILHPSPASPAANRGWAPAAEQQLRGLGVLLD